MTLRRTASEYASEHRNVFCEPNGLVWPGHALSAAGAIWDARRRVRERAVRGCSGQPHLTQLQRFGSVASPQCDSMVAVAARSRLELALGQTDKTVTAFLEQLVGEPVDAHELRHVMTQASTPNSLGVGEGHPLLQRSAVLRGGGRRSRTCTPRACSYRVASCRVLPATRDQQ